MCPSNNLLIADSITRKYATLPFLALTPAGNKTLILGTAG